MKTEGNPRQHAASIHEDLQAITRLHEIGMQLMDSYDLSAVLVSITDTALEFTGADGCIIEHADRQTGRMNVVAASGRTEGGGPGAEAAHAIPFINRAGDTSGVLKLFGCASRQFQGVELEFAGKLAKLAAGVLERMGVEEIFKAHKDSSEILYEVVGMLLENDPVQDIIERLCKRVMQYLDCDIFFNYLINPDNPATMRLNACGGVSDGEAQAVESLELGQAVCGLAAYKGERIIVEKMQSNDEERVALLRSMGIRTYVCHPLFGSNGVMGTLAFGSRRKNSFDEGELALMRAVSNHVAVAVNRLKTENELRAIADEIKEKSRLVTDYFTNISHEFKTPLSIILVDLQLMEYRLRNAGGAENSAQLGKMVNVMRQNALRLLRLIGNLLDVTKIDAGYMTVKLANKDIVGLISGIVDSVRNYADDASISLLFKGGRKQRVMPVDAEKLERIMLNLLSNAIKHTAEGGRIIASIKHEDCCVTITVEDNGEGIPDEEKGYIFDRFRQVNASLTRASEGCGIGLSLTKALVELLMGRIWFESQYGRGSKFHVQLPVLQAADGPRLVEVEGMPMDRKVEMELSDIQKIGILR